MLQPWTFRGLITRSTRDYIQVSAWHHIDQTICYVKHVLMRLVLRMHFLAVLLADDKLRHDVSRLWWTMIATDAVAIILEKTVERRQIVIMLRLE